MTQNCAHQLLRNYLALKGMGGYPTLNELAKPVNTLNMAGSVVRDLALGGVIWVGIGSKKETLNNFFEELGEKKCSKIDEWFKNVEKNRTLSV